jgi:hypothetical protein
MPCDSIVTSKVKFSVESTDMDLLARALNRMGWTKQSANVFTDNRGNSIEFRNGEIVKNMRYGATFDENQLIDEYAREIIFEAPNEHGWNINEIGPDQYEYVKGYE